jgi:hypothetical protein
MTANTSSNVHHLFIENPATWRLRFTHTGIEVLGPKFAKVGIDIRLVNTKDQARIAAELYSDYALRALAMQSTSATIDAILGDLPPYRDGLEIKQPLK